MLHYEYIHSLNSSLFLIKINFMFVHSLQKEKWMNVKVGDIIKLENNQFIAVSIEHCLNNISLTEISHVLQCLHLQT